MASLFLSDCQVAHQRYLYVPVYRVGKSFISVWAVLTNPSFSDVCQLRKRKWRKKRRKSSNDEALSCLRKTHSFRSLYENGNLILLFLMFDIEWNFRCPDKRNTNLENWKSAAKLMAPYYREGQLRRTLGCWLYHIMLIHLAYLPSYDFRVNPSRYRKKNEKLITICCFLLCTFRQFSIAKNLYRCGPLFWDTFISGSVSVIFLYFPSSIQFPNELEIESGIRSGGWKWEKEK